MTVKIDKELHIQLQCHGFMAPLSPRFLQGENAKSVRFRMLLNLPLYMENNISENVPTNEERQLYKGNCTCTCEMVHHIRVGDNCLD